MTTEAITSTMVAKWMIAGVWALFGGLAHTLVEYRKGNIKDKKDGYALVFVSFFLGASWGILAFKTYPDDFALAIFAGGFGGFLSLEGVAMMFAYIKKKFTTQ